MNGVERFVGKLYDRTVLCMYQAAGRENIVVFSKRYPG